MQRLILSGTPYALGWQHGRAYPELVHKAIKRLVHDRTIDPAHKTRVIRQVERNLGRFFPEHLEELRGIAEGAGCDYDDLLAYNFCQEISRTRPGCTNFALRTADHGVVHYKSNDVGLDNLEFHVFLEVHPDHGHALIGVTWAGTTWMNAGVNDTGLTYGGGSIPNADLYWENGLPLNNFLRAILQHCATTEEAIALCQRTPLMCHGANLMFADASGRAVVVEKSPTRLAVRRMEGDALWCTNHYLSNGTAAVLKRDNEAFRANSLGRFSLLERLTADRPHSLAQVQAIARTHADPVSICQHGPLMHSVIGYIMLPQERRMLISHGYPCQNEFQEYAFAMLQPAASAR